MRKQEKLLAEKTVGLKPSGIRRFFDLVSEMKDAISLGVGEPDFDTPWHIRDEGIYSLEKGRTFYTSNSGLKELRQEIAAYMKRSQGVVYDPMGEILITVGGSEAIDLMFRAMLNEGDEVLIPEPSYVSYVPCTILADGVPVSIPLKNENEFRLKPEELKAAITPRSKILVLPYPNNPTGAVMEKDDLAAIVDIIIENDLYVLSDEIYCELTYSGKHVSIVSFPGMKERTVLVNGFSKAYAMTGWRMGYDQDPSVRDHVRADHQPVRGDRGAQERRRRCGGDEGILQPEKTLCHAQARGNGPSVLRAPGRVLCLPLHQGVRHGQRRVRGAAS